MTTGRYAVTTLRLHPKTRRYRIIRFDTVAKALDYARTRARAAKGLARLVQKSGAYYVVDLFPQGDLIHPVEGLGDVLYRVVRGTLPQGEALLVFAARGQGKWKLRRDLSILLEDPEAERGEQKRLRDTVRPAPPKRRDDDW